MDKKNSTKNIRGSSIPRRNSNDKKNTSKDIPVSSIKSKMIKPSETSKKNIKPTNTATTKKAKVFSKPGSKEVLMPVKKRELNTGDLGINKGDKTNVVKSPEILAAPADITTLRGATVRLFATFNGYPRPTVNWLKKVSYNCRTPSNLKNL